MAERFIRVLWGFNSETEITKSPVIYFAAMFGRGRNQTGVLIELIDTAQPQTSDATGRTELINEIWPYIENANAVASTYARIDKAAILFTRPDKPLPRTPKGSVKRSAALNAYLDDIESLYACIERPID
ncbi:L-aminoadipate-semialdehyde dehydrogenase [Ceratobasidium sp. AG-Ba]|nr:L-aminoadipate-semialdehyde dehydrogenase [Ceratobasidium sp. AG-Ba]QRW03399.1 L-aminoadipate-semialdehyde dehydrogenase [Ceratobasidium sp. AG-Ba]